MMTRGSESENGLFAATVMTTGAMAAMAAASFGTSYDYSVRI